MTGTVLAFIFTGISAPVAIVSGIWLEARMPAPQPPHAGPPLTCARPTPRGLLPVNLGGNAAIREDP